MMALLDGWLMADDGWLVMVGDGLDLVNDS